MSRESTLFLLLELSATSMAPIRRVVEVSSATQVMLDAPGDSSTVHSEIRPEIEAELDTLLEAARDDIIEDGMRNVINEHLPGLVLKNCRAVIPALLAAIESGRTTPIIASEVLKELGGLRDADSHALRL